MTNMHKYTQTNKGKLKQISYGEHNEEHLSTSFLALLSIFLEIRICLTFQQYEVLKFSGSVYTYSYTGTFTL